MARTKRFDFNFKPLRIIASFDVDNSVPGVQSYDAVADEFLPDYTITPLTLQLRASCQDKDGILPSGVINQSLTNCKFYEIFNGVKTQITADNTNYTITTTTGNPNCGRIVVKRNAQYKRPITIVVEADYIDARMNQVHHINKSYLIRCDNATSAKPVVLLDSDSEVMWDPFTDPDSAVINASLRLQEIVSFDANKLKFVWHKLRSTGLFTEIGADATEDYDVSVGGTCDRQLTINRRLMGSDTVIRCYALQADDAASLAEATITDSTPYTTLTCVRRIPSIDYDFGGVPVNIPDGTLYVFPEPVVENCKGTITNPDTECHLLWSTATNTASSTNLSYAQIDHGVAPKISTKRMASVYGMVLQLEVVDAGPVASWQDSDGTILIDSDGAQLLIQ